MAGVVSILAGRIVLLVELKGQHVLEVRQLVRAGSNTSEGYSGKIHS